MAHFEPDFQTVRYAQFVRFLQTVTDNTVFMVDILDQRLAIGPEYYDNVISINADNEKKLLDIPCCFPVDPRATFPECAGIQAIHALKSRDMDVKPLQHYFGGGQEIEEIEETLEYSSCCDADKTNTQPLEQINIRYCVEYGIGNRRI